MPPPLGGDEREAIWAGDLLENLAWAHGVERWEAQGLVCYSWLEEQEGEQVNGTGLSERNRTRPEAVPPQPPPVTLLWDHDQRACEKELISLLQG